MLTILWPASAGFAIFLGIALVAAGLREWRLRRFYMGLPAGEAV